MPARARALAKPAPLDSTPWPASPPTLMVISLTTGIQLPPWPFAGYPAARSVRPSGGNRRGISASVFLVRWKPIRLYAIDARTPQRNAESARPAAAPRWRPAAPLGGVSRVRTDD